MTQAERDLRYQRCMVLAGGGFRFGYYLGMHAAAVDAGRAPDLLLATCGGAVAGAIIAGLPDSASRKAWLQSPQMHAFFRDLRSGPRATPLRALTGAAMRYASRTQAARIPDLFDDYLFEIPHRLPLPVAVTATSAVAPALAILGGRLLFDRSDVGRQRHDRALYHLTLFGNQRIAALTQATHAAMHGWTSTVAADLHADSTMPVSHAVRISIADMFYFPAQQANGAYYTGGAVDLMPIELAHRLAHHVTMEIKQPYSQWTAIPALRAVIGIDGNQRMQQVCGQWADCWIDTSDAHIALRRTGIQKRINWRQNRIELVAPASYDDYASDMETQWRYGYQRAQKACKA